MSPDPCLTPVMLETGAMGIEELHTRPKQLVCPPPMGHERRAAREGSSPSKAGDEAKEQRRDGSR